MAVKYGLRDVVQQLLDLGANATDQTNMMETSLHLASSTGDDALIRLLVERQANIEARDKIGETPLHWACLWVQPRSVKLLVQLGADINARDALGCTPLHHACHVKKNLQVVRMLLELGCEVNAQDREGNTAVHIAIRRKQRSYVRLLVKHGSDMEILNGKRETPKMLMEKLRDESNNVTVRVNTDHNRRRDHCAVM